MAGGSGRSGAAGGGRPGKRLGGWSGATRGEPAVLARLPERRRRRRRRPRRRGQGPADGARRADGRGGRADHRRLRNVSVDGALGRAGRGAEGASSSSSSGASATASACCSRASVPAPASWGQPDAQDDDQGSRPRRPLRIGAGTARQRPGERAEAREQRGPAIRLGRRLAVGGQVDSRQRPPRRRPMAKCFHAGCGPAPPIGRPHPVPSQALSGLGALLPEGEGTQQGRLGPRRTGGGILGGRQATGDDLVAVDVRDDQPPVRPDRHPDRLPAGRRSGRRRGPCRPARHVSRAASGR